MAQVKDVLMEKVAVVGLGYVGLPVAVLSRTKGFDVLGIDLDQPKLEKIKKGQSPITDDFVEDRLKPNLIKVSNNFRQIKGVGVIVVCVPTPVKNDYLPNLEPLKNACAAIAQNMSKGSLVILESTINPGVSDEIIIPLMEKASGFKCGKDFFLAHCPERINPGDPDWNVQNIPRVIGANNKTGLKLALDFYNSILSSTVKPMQSLKEAESVKIVENAFRDVNIAFVNELAMSFSKLGINVKNVIDGAATKPFSFLPHYPGVGVGGHCIPVDPYYLIEYAKQKGFNHDFLLLARDINNQMPEFTMQLLIDGLNEAGLALSKAKVAVLGISYKPNVGDDRESPAYKIVKLLKEKGAQFDAYDPYFLDKSDTKSLDATLEDKDAVLLVTAHNEFLDLTPALLKKYDIKVFIDGRNVYHDQKPEFTKNGVFYSGIGI